MSTMRLRFLWTLLFIAPQAWPGEDPLGTAIRLARVQEKSGDLLGGIRTLELAIKAETSPTEQARFALALNELGGMYLHAAKLPESERTLRRAVRLLEAVYGPDSVQAQSPIANLAAIDSLRGRVAEAQTSLERALRIRGSALGENEPSDAMLWASLSEIHLRRGQNTQSENCALRALDIIANRASEYPRVAAMARNVLGIVKSRRGDIAGGLRELYAGVAAVESGLSPTHPEILALLLNVAALHIELQQWTGAEAPLNRALQITRTQPAGTHPEEARVLKILSVVYRHTGRRKQSRKLEKAAQASALAWRRNSQAPHIIDLRDLRQ